MQNPPIIHAMRNDKAIHILRGGQALCGFSTRPPNEWSNEHLWIAPENARVANCIGCVRKFLEGKVGENIRKDLESKLSRLR